eukprot:9701052-Alexandrium_andersonii.AAC.1
MPPGPPAGRGAPPAPSRRRPPLGTQTARPQAGCTQVREHNPAEEARAEVAQELVAGALGEEVGGDAGG